MPWSCGLFLSSPAPGFLGGPLQPTVLVFDQGPFCLNTLPPFLHEFSHHLLGRLTVPCLMFCSPQPFLTVSVRGLLFRPGPFTVGGLRFVACHFGYDAWTLSVFFLPFPLQSAVVFLSRLFDRQPSPVAPDS